MSKLYTPKKQADQPGWIRPIIPNKENLRKKQEENNLLEQAREGKTKNALSLTLGEIFKLVAEAKTKSERLSFLKIYDSTTLRYLVRLAFDPTITWNLPKGAPPYKPLITHPGYGETNLFKEARRLYIFLNTPKSPKLSALKREALFISLLETLEQPEAELILSIKEKKIPGMTTKLVKEAFPGLLPEEAKE